jgi:hypothetical protein
VRSRWAQHVVVDCTPANLSVACSGVGPHLFVVCFAYKSKKGVVLSRCVRGMVISAGAPSMALSLDMVDNARRAEHALTLDLRRRTRQSKGFKEGRNAVAPGVGPLLVSGIKWIDTRVDGGLIGWRGGGRGRANCAAH